jgi:tetratricopeptide (TPR) repeat protein
VRSPQKAAEEATGAFQQVLTSLEGILSGKKLDTGVLTGQPIRQSVSYTAAVAAPSEEELYWIYKSNGLPAAENAVTAAKSGARNVFDESLIITIAKELGYSNKPQESLDMFRLAAYAFPKSITAQLAAADALGDAGLKSEAMGMYQNVLRLDPNNQAAKEALHKLGE